MNSKIWVFPLCKTFKFRKKFSLIIYLNLHFSYIILILNKIIDHQKPYDIYSS
jgi:hypothetical protein